jgi:TRAP-type C4-dicarboxylate transport system permease small subunit
MADFIQTEQAHCGADAINASAVGHKSAFRTGIEGAGRLGDVLATALILILTAMIGYEVIARYVFSNPTGFANQFAAYSMPVITFLAAAATLRKDGHVSVDILSKRFPGRLQILTEGFSVVLIAFITIAAGFYVYESWESGTRTFSTAVTFPEYWPQMVMPIGLLFLTLQQGVGLIDAIRRYQTSK